MNEQTLTYFNSYVQTSGKSLSGFKSRTISQYRREIERFEAWLGKDFSEAVRADAESYYTFRSAGYAPTTLSKSMHILSAFGAYLEEKTSYKNPFYVVSSGLTCLDYNGKELPDNQTLEPVFVSIEETDRTAGMVARIMNAVGCGLEELLAITTDCVEIAMDEQRIALLFHNYAPYQMLRRVVLPEYLFEPFLAFLQQVPETDNRGNTNRFLFTNSLHKPMSAWTCADILRKAGSPYTLQQFKVFASLRLADSGATISEISDYTGRTDKWLYRYKNVHHLPPSLADRENTEI